MNDADRRFGPEVEIDSPAFIHPTALIYGKVSIGAESSLFPYAVIRAESLEIRIGRYANLQDHTMLHVGYELSTSIGDYCSITHKATVHGAAIGETTLIGINATVMDGATIGENCVIGAHCVVPEGMQILDNSVVVGVPAKIVRTRNNFIANRRNAMIYHWNACAFARGEHRAWHGPAFEAYRKTMMEEIEAEFRQRYPDEAEP